MSITTVDGYIAAAKQIVAWNKTAALTSVANGYYSMFAQAGNPGAGTLAGSSTAAGVIQNDSIAGYPVLNAFGGGATGILSRVEAANTVAGHIYLYDRIWLAGAYAFNANTAVTSPSWSARVPSYQGLELWVEQVTAATGNQAVNVTYTPDGSTSHTTGAVGIAAAPAVGRCWQLPLQAGDSAVQTITNVQGSVASAGTFNVMLLRPLKKIPIMLANLPAVFDILGCGLAQVYADSALYALVLTNTGTSSGTPNLLIEVANG